MVEGDRPDLEIYVGIVDELGARTVVDVGCGTGSLACMLSRRDISVNGVDPAAASLRFRTREEIVTDLEQTGFRVQEVRDAPDRPGAELVFIAQRA